MNNEKIDFSVQSEMFKQTLIDTINSSNLPLSMAFYILKDVFQDVESYYQQYINKQYAEMQKQQQASSPSTNESEESDGQD